MKIAINKCFGGFGLSKAVFDELEIAWDGYGYLDNKAFGISNDADYNEWRSHPKLIAAIETIGEGKASGDMANVQVVEIPDNIEWELDEYDGIESIHETHRSW